MPVRAILFDFDGTLAHSFAGITASTNHVRARHGLDPLTEDEVRRYVGYGLDHLMRTLVPTAPAEKTVAEYREHHKTAMLTGTKLMPGAGDSVRELAARGYKMAVCSNKRVEFTRELVGVLGLGSYFAAVLGPDDVAGRAKPDPAMLLEGLTRLGATAAEAVYVGDMSIDVETSKAAGVPAWLVPGGAGGWDEALAAGPDRVLTSFAELLELLPGVTS